MIFEEINKSEYRGMRIAAIDFGLKRVGIAVSDPLHILASPLRTLIYDEATFWQQISEIYKKQNISLTVLGYPMHETANNSSLLNNIREFRAKLEKVTHSKVIFRDESFTSKYAAHSLVESGKRKKKRQEKGQKDMIAAALILQDFLREL